MENFNGKWRFTILEKNAGFDQRVVITGAAAGNGNYAGTPGVQFNTDGNNFGASLQWNNNAGSGWRDSAVLVSAGLSGAISYYKELKADDNFPSNRDGDYDDLIVKAQHTGPLIDVVQRPFAIDRGTLMMMPDGIFDTSQGIQFMGVRIKNTWFFNWTGFTEMMVGISNSSKAVLLSQGIQVIDNWTSAEQTAFQQQVVNGYVMVPNLQINEEKLIYFKVNISASSPSKPFIEFVARRTAPDSSFDAPGRCVRRQIFISSSFYDSTNKQLVAEVPEGTVYMKLKRILIDRDKAEKSVAYARAHPCKKQSSSSRSDCDQLKHIKRYLAKCAKTDIKKVEAILEQLGCKCNTHDDCHCDDPVDSSKPGTGGLATGPGSDHWCRYKPFPWLPIEFEYRIVPRVPFSGQFGPLAFEDPWWKIVLIILAVLLAAASVVVDSLEAGEDPEYQIGKIIQKSQRASGTNVDAALSDLNGSRSLDFGVWEAQSDDPNNNLPITGMTGGIIPLNRTDNGDAGIEDAVLNDIVFKSGARSGTTRGIISSVSATRTVSYDSGPAVTYSNQIIVEPLASPDDQPLSQHGDSGSLWVKLSDMRPVGLNFGAPTSDDGSYAIVNPIREVVNLFNIHFNQ